MTSDNYFGGAPTDMERSRARRIRRDAVLDAIGTVVVSVSALVTLYVLMAIY